MTTDNFENRNPEIAPTNVMTGGTNHSRYLYYQLKISIARARQIDIIVSFLMESGVRMILSDLKAALDRGVPVRILTGNYLGITQPSALYLIKKTLGERIDLRFFNDSHRSFHPKSYIFHYDQDCEIYIGSSNLSRSALTSGIEWNYRFSRNQDPKDFDLFYSSFEDLFENHSIVISPEVLKQYSAHWHKPAVAKDLERYDIDSDTEMVKVRGLFELKGVQIEALYALENTRRDGAEKALVHAATGVGKTYIAAFDSAKYERVLFVAHREEILKQAARAFSNVRQSDDYGFFYGVQKDTGPSVIFASVSTLGRSEYLNERYFAPDRFQYLIVDEFHHAVTDQYQRIINYFRPDFMLGLTATPERMDGRSIYEICNYNVPYEITLKDAINKGMLVPFHYYGIYDETDYSGLHIVRGRYDEKELNETYIGNVYRYDLIYKYYTKYHSNRALGFCSSRAHAEDMAREFCERGIASAAVYSNASGKYSMDRDSAIQDLKEGKIQVIFSVDMFNEGVDIPAVDMVLFLRPTESPVVFLQQLGRGLRKAPGKAYLNVLDFIGNYEKAGRAPFLLSDTEPSAARSASGSISPNDLPFPDDCIVDFDMWLIDLFKRMEERGMTVRQRILQEYERIKEGLNHPFPTRMELFRLMDDSIYQLCINNSASNPFRQYLDYRHDLHDLSPDEETLYGSIGREFISLIEKTNMTKVYKMPVLMSFFNNGKIRSELTEDDLLETWKAFFSTNDNWKDLGKDITREEYLQISDRAHLSNILKNPVNFLKKSGKGFFTEKEGYAIALNDELRDVILLPAFSAQMKDVIEYRTAEYYRRRYQDRKDQLFDQVF